MMTFKNQIAMGSVCFVLGVILAVQYSTIQKNYLSGISPFSRQTDLTTELITLKEEKVNLVKELEAARVVLQEIEEAASEDNAIIKNLNNTVRDYEILAGMTDVIGEGIIVTLDDPPSDPNLSYEYTVTDHYEKVVLLINELNSAGAEAISINEQRVISISEIRAAGNSINVNFVPQTLPIIIKAIGKKSALEGSLTGRYGLVPELRRYQLLVDVNTMDEIIIPRYRGKIDFQYANTVKEE